MVKGVSKTVIVVNDTGSRLFEKIVFYVTPEYGTLSAKQLKKAAGQFSFHYTQPGTAGALRKRAKRRKRLTLLALAGAALLAIGTALILFSVF